MYLVPLASHQPIPPELLPFDRPGKIDGTYDMKFLWNFNFANLK